MKLLKVLIVLLSLMGSIAIQAQVDSQSEIEQITETLLNYIEGTANGQPERLEKAFHPDFNLYSVTDSDSLRVWEGADYVSRITPGKKNNRVGRIIAIDFENNAATAKVEIDMPGFRYYTDYFLLLKYQGSWKIIHKSYSWRDYPKPKEDK